MDLTENKNPHPNKVSLTADNHFQTATDTYSQSIIVPWDAPITTIEAKHSHELDSALIEQLCDYHPEIIILATGEVINYPDPELLIPLVTSNIGLEVMSNAAAARTFNVLMAENRQVLCVFLIAD